jgi:hypothetical protein
MDNTGHIKICPPLKKAFVRDVRKKGTLLTVVKQPQDERVKKAFVK